jgi:PBP4 family serine-type D-alanyl-D-alanine carboxypeptidase
LSETLRHFNHVSENAVGEVLLHEFAVRAGIERPTWSDGARLLSERLVGAGGLDAESFRLVDGSGLSRYNLISADSAVRVLLWMERHPQRAAFYDALPRYDVDAARDADGAAAAAAGAVRVAAKPGGMASVSTISGYLDAQSGRRLAFSLLVNGFSGSNRPILALRQQVWQLLAQFD